MALPFRQKAMVKSAGRFRHQSIVPKKRFRKKGYLECHLKYIRQNCFSYFLNMQQTNRGQLTVVAWYAWAIWYYMARWEKSGKGKNRWETSHFCRPEPRPTTPAAYVWYINVFIPKQKIFKTEYQPIIIERQRINQTYTESWYLLTVWQLFHNYSVQFVSKEQFQSQFQLQSCLCVYWLS